MKKTYFPSNSLREGAVLNALKELGGEAITEQISNRAVKLNALSEVPDLWIKLLRRSYVNI